MGQQQPVRVSMLVAILVQFIPLKADGGLQISGHETPVYIGMSKTVTCTWTGIDNIAKVQWYLVGLEEVEIGEKIDNITTKLTTGRMLDVNWNGKLFVCKATTTNGEIVKKYFTLWVKNLENKVTITPPCKDTFMAGESHILTCTVKSSVATNLTWVRIINGKEVEVVNTQNIIVQAQTAFNNNSAEKSITFKPLATSHAGKYKCVSVLNITDPKILSTKELECAVSIKNATSLSIPTLTPTSTPTAKSSCQSLGTYVIVGVVATVIILISICVTSFIIVIKSRYWKNFHHV